MRPLRRAALLVVALSVLAASLPSRALAISTQQEIRAGQAEDEQITSSQVMETDPLLNAYAREIAERLWKQVARKDLPYNIKVIKASDINSFATEGGFVYIDEGVIDFVQSDDEFASVIGHETGHIERRHVVTLNTKAEIVEILASLASIFSPFLLPASSLLGQAVIMKMSREDELEADRYGLQLMSRAGYDPDAMVTLMRHMSILADDHSELLDKYLEDHPDPEDRVSHLLGYPELDPRIVTEAQRLVQADSDAERARYSYASIKLHDILAHDPGNVDALLKLAHVQIALGLTNKAQQTLALADRLGSPQARAVVAMSDSELRGLEVHDVQLAGVDPDYAALHQEIATAQRGLEQTAATLQTRKEDAHAALEGLQAQLRELSDDLPNISGTPAANSPLANIMNNLTAISRAVNSGIDDASQVLDNVGSLSASRDGGVLGDTRELLEELAQPLSVRPVPDETVAMLGAYPQLLRSVDASENDLVRAVELASQATAAMDQGVTQLQDSMRALTYAYQSGYGQPAQDFGGVSPRVGAALATFNAAATTASQAAQLYNMARARALSVRITLLGVGSSPQRYALFRYALEQRFASDGVDYATMVHDGLTPGDVAAATILAADTQSTPQAVIDESLRTKTPIVDLANEHGMHAWPLEIFMRLVYMDYTDDPVREMSTRAPGGAAGDD